MSEQSFTISIPRAWNVGTIEEADAAAMAEAARPSAPPVVSITLAGDWPEDLRERVFDAMRWAATRAALSSQDYGDQYYLERWEQKNPKPVGLRSSRDRDDGARG